MNSIQKRIYKAAQDLTVVTQTPEREARLLMAYALNTTYEEVYLAADRLITDEEEREFNMVLQRRLKHEPLSKIKEYREFWSLSFRVTADTLDPRPDSETLIEAIMSCYPDKARALRILDLGTGTGCLLLSLLHEYPNAWGIGVDRSEAASHVAKENASLLNLDHRAVFIVGNWGDALVGTFDIIISNPPYIGRNEVLPPDVALYDPELALYGGEDGLSCYRALAKQIPNHTTPNSRVFLELGDGQLEAVTSIFSFATGAFTVQDLNNKERCFVFCVETMRVC